MHVAPSDFQAARRQDVLLEYAVLGEVTFAVLGLPATGSRGTFLEEWCSEPHWALALGGELDLELDGEEHEIPPGTVFHLPTGQRHRMRAAGPARIAGFGRKAPEPVIEAELAKAGFEPVHPAPADARGPVTVHRPQPARAAASREIVAGSRRMGDLLFTRAQFGPRSGYASMPCDLPHWGLVTSGSLAIESEDAVEVLSAGDVFYLPPGPPGHRFQAADPAIVVDFTPIDAFERSERVANWRRTAADAALADAPVSARLELAALV